MLKCIKDFCSDFSMDVELAERSSLKTSQSEELERILSWDFCFGL